MTIAANGLLREITRRAPRTLEDLAKVPEIRDWQVEEHGDTLVRIVNEVLDDATVLVQVDGAAKKRRRRRGRRPGAPAAEAVE